jgi:signal peptidase I
VTDENANDYFSHLQPPTGPARKPRPKPAEPDPFSEAPVPAPRSQMQRPPATKPVTGLSPGLSPGIPKLGDAPVPASSIKSGVVLTPQGVKRVDDPPKAPPRPQQRPQSAQPRSQAPAAQAKPAAPKPAQRPATAENIQRTPPPPPMADDSEEVDADIDAVEASRAKNVTGDVSWKEYAATDFPAVDSEELGVKTAKTESGRVVPVAIRSDLTDEALKGRSIKDKGKGKPIHLEKGKPKGGRPPKSFIGRMGASLIMAIRGKGPEPEVEEDATDIAEREGSPGFEKSGSKPARRSRGPLAVVRSVFVEVAKLLLLILLLKAYVLQISLVQGTSMEPTLLGATESRPGDRLLVERVTAHVETSELKLGDRQLKDLLPEFMRPRFRRGDIVVVRSPEDPGTELVKRLIALPGDVIRFKDGKVEVKEGGAGEFKAADEFYLGKHSNGEDKHAFAPSSLPDLLADGRELEVPQGRIFVMGDNRDASNDSRGWLNIEVRKAELRNAKGEEVPSSERRLWAHLRSIEGRVVFRLYPFDRMWPPLR